MRQIIAGSAGFSVNPRNPYFDRYVLGSAAADCPKVGFIPTASGDSDKYVGRFYSFFNRQDCEPSHLSIFRGNFKSIREYILGQDIVYVGGGNTKNMLSIWRDWGVDQVLQEAYHAEIVLTGISAGSICWFDQGITDSIPGNYTALDCLGFLPGSNCPFHDSEGKSQRYQELVSSGELAAGWATDVGSAVHFRNDEFYRAIGNKQGAHVYRYFADRPRERVPSTFLARTP